MEFLARAEILHRFGPHGITRYAPTYGGIGKITDDTQMALFTAEGLLRGWVRSRNKGITTCAGVTVHAYLRWLRTQGMEPEHNTGFAGADESGWLFRQQALHSRRAPGNACLSALREKRTFEEPARNDSEGCGGVMRAAPVGLFAWRLREEMSHGDTFKLGTEPAALTHGHPTGALTGGVLAGLIQNLTDGMSLANALAAAKAILQTHAEHEETLQAIEQTELLSANDLPHEDAISRLGKGWVAEEAPAIAIYYALVARDFEHGVILAVNHDGDSDSTDAITGNLLGTMQGAQAIPAHWLEPLDLRDVITEITEDLHAFRDWDIGEYSNNRELNDRIGRKYPGF